MKKIIATAVVASTLALSAVAPAQAARDGETGYTIACLIHWLSGRTQLCQELLY